MTKLAFLISKQEGFGIPDTIPTTHNNPGDLRHSPHSSHTPEDPNGIGMIDTVVHGWEDLERQLQIYAERKMTVQEMVYEYAPPGDDNDTEAYLSAVCDGLNLSPSTPVAEALKLLEVVVS